MKTYNEFVEIHEGSNVPKEIQRRINAVMKSGNKSLKNPDSFVSNDKKLNSWLSKTYKAVPNSAGGWDEFNVNNIAYAKPVGDTTQWIIRA